MNRMVWSARIALALCLSTCGFGLAQETAEQVVEPSLKVPREKLLEWKSGAGKAYWYKLPAAIEERRPPDLVLMLHGTGLDHRWSFWNYPILAGQFRKRDIVVSPDGLTPGGGDKFNFVQGKADGDQIVEIIESFRKRLPIGRVFLYGHSQGAFFTYWFAGEHPELVDGFVAHAGNVLDVKHSKLAKQKLAVAILHGRADAVVPVECAFRTEKIYREAGYEKLKLEIVEGLDARSGHWPLPESVARLFEWLDQASTANAVDALAAARAEIEKESPDMRVVATSLSRARKLLSTVPTAEVAAFQSGLAEIEKITAAFETSQLALITADPAFAASKPVYGDWVPRFRELDAAFADRPDWQKTTRRLREIVGRHDKAVEKARKALERPNRESRSRGVEVWEDSFLSAYSDELLQALGRAFENAEAKEAATKSAFESRRASGEKQAIEVRKSIQEAALQAIGRKAGSSEEPPKP